MHMLSLAQKKKWEPWSRDWAKKKALFFSVTFFIAENHIILRCFTLFWLFYVRLEIENRLQIGSWL